MNAIDFERSGVRSTEQRCEASIEKARRAVMTYGWNSTSYQILNPGISHWFSVTNNAVTGFVACNGVLVVAGAPVSTAETLKEVAAEFERYAAKRNNRVCYFGAESRLEAIYSNSPNHAKVLLGAQPVWSPRNWEKIVAEHGSIRSQLNRARNKGVQVAAWPSEKVQDSQVLLDTLKAWLASKGLPPLTFMVEPNTLSRVNDRRVFVATRGDEVVGFVLLSPVATRNGWLFEQFVHTPGSPNGTVELMIDFAMRSLADDGAEYATLGLSPLSRRAQIDPFRNPLWLRIFLAWMRKHGQRFYNFDGLDAFKAKLRPESWEPIFAISNEPRFSFRTLRSIAAAFSGNAPARLFIGGLWRAFATEIEWLRNALASSMVRGMISR